MKIRVLVGNRDICVPIDEDTVITVVSDDDDRLLGIDFSSYDPETATLRDVVVGHWPDDKEWVPLAEIPMEDK